MHFCAIGVVSLALAPALSLAEPRPYLLRAASPDQMFGLLKRDMPGYAPSSTFCGRGATCAEACGPTFVQCPSSDNQIHCFDPSVKQVCCTDGSGLPCDDGYYCTKDSSGGTWCCPNELDLTACAAKYTVTGALSSVSALTAAPSPGEVTTSTVTVSSTSTASVVASAGTIAATTTKVTPANPASNSTVSTISATFTGAANAHALGGFALPLALAGALAAL